MAPASGQFNLSSHNETTYGAEHSCSNTGIGGAMGRGGMSGGHDMHQDGSMAHASTKGAADSTELSKLKALATRFCLAQ